MSKTDTRLMTAHVPVSMADWNACADERDQLTQEALANVDAGQVTDHQAVLAWADSLGSDQPLSVPR
ncbi:MAG: CopG family transcriptional regulator [Marinobacter sp.]